MERVKGELLYEGKAKKMYAVQGRPQEVWVEYKDSLTAFNAQKKSSFAGKGSTPSLSPGAPRRAVCGQRWSMP